MLRLRVVAAGFIFGSLLFGRAESAPSCVKLRIPILLKNKRSKCDTSYGHSGIGVENAFYDFGPQNETTHFLLFGVQSAKWWARTDKQGHQPTTTSILQFLANQQFCRAELFTLWVEPREARMVEEYWARAYQNYSKYSLLGKQCTSVVYGSLFDSGIVQDPRAILYPKSLFRRLSEALVNTCGQDAGRPARRETLHL